MASGTSATTWSVRTMQRWRSGTRVIARRPWSGVWSSTMVPVSAMPTRAAVTTATQASSSAALSTPASPEVSEGSSTTARGTGTSSPAGTTTGPGPVGRRRCAPPARRRCSARPPRGSRRRVRRRGPPARRGHPRGSPGSRAAPPPARRRRPRARRRPARRAPGRGSPRAPRPAPAVDVGVGVGSVIDSSCGGVSAVGVRPPSVRCHQARNDSGGGAGRSRAPVQAAPGPGRRPAVARPPGSEVRERRARALPVRPEAFSTRPRRRASVKAQAAAFMATASALGTRSPRWPSTTWERRWTSTSGMSMRTGQTSKQAPHSEEA